MPFEINKTELVWPGKYDEEGNLVQPPRVSLPFQVIERVNETRATREAKKAEGLTLFDVWDGSKEGSNFEDGWRNKLIWGDNALVMSSLEGLRGKFKMIYIDPPFDVGADFSVKVSVGDYEIAKASSLVEEVAYRDTWGRGRDSYLSMIQARLLLIRDLLGEDGVLFVHVDWRMDAAVRLLLDETFGESQYRNSIIWQYAGKGLARVKSNLVRNYATIFMYSKSDKFLPNLRSGQVSDSVLQRWGRYMNDEFQITFGALRNSGDKLELEKAERTFFNSEGRQPTDSDIARDYSEGSLLRDVWSDIPIVRENLTYKEYVGYPTQKPVALLERLIEIATVEGDLIGDFFCGSGTTLVTAEMKQRKWVGADLGRFAVHTTRKRLLEIEKCKPFEVLNLGSYERQFWSTSNFGQDLDGDGKVNLLEYIAFILKLYGGEPIAGSTYLHGRKGDAYVYVGAVSNPVTIAEIEQAVNECKKMKGAAVHVLGWEWEMGLHDPIVGEAKRLGVKLTLKQIPREVMEAEAVRKGQIKFFDLAYLDVELQQKSNGEVVCALTDFSTPNTDLIPDEVRESIKKWSDYVDYWAVDWDFQNDTFNHGFVTYRTRQDRTLTLKSDPHTYPKAGTYKVMIKVIDIFGNDTSKLVELKVKG